MSIHRIHLDVESLDVDPYSIFGQLVATHRGELLDYGIEELGTENYADGRYDDDDDEVTASDVIAVLSRMNLSHDNKLSRMRDELVSMAERGEHIELSVRDGVPHIDSDPTPPHGIERPEQGRGLLEALADTKHVRPPRNGPDHGVAHPANYWIDPTKHPTQGSGRRVPGLESVPCPSCGAPAGEPCMADSHAGYRRSHGHAARYKAFSGRSQ